MKILRAYSLWTTAGVALFVIGGFALGTARFGVGVFLLAASAVCLGTAMGSHRRWIKKHGAE